MAIKIDGRNLTIEDVVRVAERCRGLFQDHVSLALPGRVAPLRPGAVGETRHRGD